ncbi:HAD family phosphatase [Brachybacterium sp. MASK1Z-5]|uniref:HAD family phosphatase n=1 Tax=Brachybacterium halotolerans TaxID=2795215 RepID=A0ABS1BBI0_9MICO|nr:HAD family phosphatase [Brachybacterium halotolerans]MBK0331983.1 HAD family phosphatase [Brachybacterium halotolerans]
MNTPAPTPGPAPAPAAPSPESPVPDAAAPGTSGDRFREAFGDWTPRAVVFDCDGMLLDTETAWSHRTQPAILARYGVDPAAAEGALPLGLTVEDASRVIADLADAPYEEVLHATRERFRSDVAGDLDVLPGVHEVLAATSSRVPIACASNSWHEMLEDKLGRAGLRDYFRVLESADTVERGKPFPDMYEAGARALGAQPAQALAFEDSHTGARAARSAGLRLITIPQDGEAPPADLSLRTLADPGLLSWIESW